MDFQWNVEAEDYRREFEDYFREAMKHAPPGWMLAGLGELEEKEEVWEFHSQMQRDLGERGWLAMAWPKEYGGLGVSHMIQFIFNEVRGYYEAPGVDIFGVGMIGPTLMLHGTKEQKKEFLPSIARGEINWSQAWSEPNAGSDLAALTTRAISDGDDYIVNGQKVWTSAAHHAQWTFTLVRTDPNQPRHRGITYLLMPLDSPGVEIRPLPNIARQHHYNEIFFTDVRVPKRYRVGEENRGWYITLDTMNFERSGIERIASLRRRLEELVQFCRETKWNGKVLADSPLVRNRLADLAIDYQVARSYCLQIMWAQMRGAMTAPMASAAKVFGSELLQHVARMGLTLMGQFGGLEKGSKWAPLQGRFILTYMEAPGGNIAAGTSEIHRNIIAWRGLGLPRT